MNARPPIAVITGGSRGLGRSMALKLAERGVDVVVTYRSGEAEADAVVARIAGLGRRGAALALDVGDSAGFADFAARLQATLRDWQSDRFDYLVNNAGIGIAAQVADLTEADFDTLMRIHLKGPFFLTQRLLPSIADGGRIVNISTGLTRFEFPGYAAYAAMKGGVEVLTRYLAKELGARGICVNTVAPGAIETDFRGGAIRDDPEAQRLIAAQTALGRVGQADDIGDAVASLLTSPSRWINGQRIEASGGMFL